VFYRVIKAASIAKKFITRVIAKKFITRVSGL
jgi:hypothetical protein